MSGDLILVTGGGGFIGSNVTAALAARGQRVIVCDWLETGDKWRNLEDVDLYDIVPPTLLNETLRKHDDRISAIVHMGAISATTERDADRLVENNVRLTIDLWDWSIASGASFLYASSAAVYGDGAQGFDDDWSVEALARLRPLNGYGWSKLVADRRFARDVAEGAPTPRHWAGLRFFNVYGTREEHKGSMRSVVSQITPRVTAGERVTLFRSHHPDYEDGGQLRDFVHVDDCVSVILWLLDHPEANGIFNLGTGQARSFRDLATSVFVALDRDPAIDFVDTPVEIRDRYQYFTQAEMGRLRAAGYDRPFASLEEGVAGTVRDWTQRYGGNR
ncbi:ADP-glyceromanno-heptose 6-epimerase [Sphingomonas suaedae]|uniref:ADP-glyceromanno-heptose 6-epimerase n=1 Tax=Sphingomonas suaedae TaxID=2599297 RepID=UPI001C97D242|nr:ADP-glyceromanno-heptose 6-epimerase [Sphingomonas suaedae]